LPAFLLVASFLHHKLTLPTQLSAFSLVSGSSSYDLYFMSIMDSAEALPLSFSPQVAKASDTQPSMDKGLGAL
jgi:hypothetical protein